MYYYQIAEVVLGSECKLPSFETFACNEKDADIILVKMEGLPSTGTDSRSGSIVHRRLENGWFFHGIDTDQIGIYVSEDYASLGVLGEPSDTIHGMNEWFVRIAIECALAHRGYLSLHAAAVEVEGESFAFTGPSGIGKSTRAAVWIKSLKARLINGDRPLIDVRSIELYGVPWDGKERCFLNAHYPLKAVCEIRRSKSVYVRNLSYSQRKKLLMRQSFLPMWDTETTTIQMANITRLAEKANIVRVFCGPTERDASVLYETLQKRDCLREEKDMKAKKDFALRNVVDEYILMPTGDNIGKFKGTVLLNEVSAFVWEKLQNPLSREDLLKAILDEFEVDKNVAVNDLDTLLATLKEYGVIEDD